jgi:AraC-like DNA-binding protein
MTPQSPRESFHCEVVRDCSYGAQWHFHPEHQLTLVLKSRGYRVVGDSLAALAEGDLVLVGANLPHVWHQDETQERDREAVHAIVVRFTDNFLGQDFLHSPEMELVRKLLQHAARGLQISGRTQKEAAERMKALAGNEELSRLVELLSLLDLLARSRDLKPLSSPKFAPDLKGSDQGRMARVLSYVHDHLTEGVERSEAAARASLSTGAFSRFFKTRTGKTLPQYVNELRVGRACSRLLESDIKISDLALDCGFENLANFNRQFRAVTGLAPRAYRERVNAVGR